MHCGGGFLILSIITFKTVTMKLISRMAVLSVITLSCVGCDQSTKVLAQNILRGQSSVSYFDGLLSFVYAENVGAMLSLGSTLPESLRFILFVLLVGVVLAAAILYILFKPLNASTVMGVSLAVGGGLSNLIDRLYRDGSVIDFMVIKIGSLESGIFNVADVAITLGVCILYLPLIRSKGKRYS